MINHKQKLKKLKKLKNDKKIKRLQEVAFLQKSWKTPVRGGVLSAECNFTREPHFLWKTLLELDQTLAQESSKD